MQSFDTNRLGESIISIIRDGNQLLIGCIKNPVGKKLPMAGTWRRRTGQKIDILHSNYQSSWRYAITWREGFIFFISRIKTYFLRLITRFFPPSHTHLFGPTPTRSLHIRRGKPKLRLGGIVEADITTRKNKKQKYAMRHGVGVYKSEREGERTMPKEAAFYLLWKVLVHHWLIFVGRMRSQWWGEGRGEGK